MRLALFFFLMLSVASTVSAAAQTIEELRKIYEAKDFARMEEIANSGDVRAEIWMAHIRQQQGRRPEAKEWWRRAAVKGDTQAIDNLAVMHHMDGEYEEAGHWFRVGSDSGDPALRLRYGRLLVKGYGNVKKDEAEGASLIADAARKDYPYAYLELAQLYSNGTGVSRDPVEALALAMVAEVSLDTSGAENATRFRETIEPGLTPQQKSAAFERAASWHPDFRKRYDRLNNDPADIYVKALILLVFVIWFLIWEDRRFARANR